MSAGSAVQAGRMAALAQMTLTLTAYSPNGSAPDVDGYDIPAFTDEGECPGKVQAGSQAGSDMATRYVSIGDTERPVLSGGLHIPLDHFVSDGLLIQASEQRGVGWEFEVADVGPDDDAALLGRRYLVVEVPAKSYATARRLDVVEL